MNFEKMKDSVKLMLNMNNGQMNYMKLIKLLYIVDRTALGEYGFTVTEDSYINMRGGPGLSGFLDLIKGKATTTMQSGWNALFETIDHDIKMKTITNEHLTYKKLNKYEKNLIKTIYDEYKNKDECELVDITHEFPEWRNPETQMKNSFPLTIRDILLALNKDTETIEYIISTIKADMENREFFRRKRV